MFRQDWRATLATAAWACSMLVVGVLVCAHQIDAQQLTRGERQDSDQAADFRQVRLEPGDIKRFLAAQKALAAIAPKLEASGDPLDDELQKKLDRIIVAHGFKTVEDFEDVRSTIMLVLAGIDPDTGIYSNPIELIERDIEQIKADTTMTDQERAAQVSEMEAALSQLQPLEHIENIDLVKTYVKQIEDALN